MVFADSAQLQGGGGRVAAGNGAQINKGSLHRRLYRIAILQSKNAIALESFIEIP